MSISRWWYYLRSIPTLLFGIREPLKIVGIFTGLPVRLPTTIETRNGYRFRVRSAMDIWIIKEICLDRDYERHSVPIEDGWTVLDIGAGLGDFSMFAARHNQRGTIYAYEPYPESYELLCVNARLNDAPNVRAFPMALSGCGGTVALDTSTGEPVRHSVVGGGGTEAIIEIECITLADVLDEHGIEQCDYLKMDCEGAEYEILMQADRQTLNRLRHLCIEYHDGFTPHSGVDLARFLEEHGFRVEVYPSTVHGHLGLLSATKERPAATG